MKRAFQSRPVTPFILLLLLSGVFIFSALTKFASVEPFEWSFMDMGFSNNIAFFLARFFIGFEFMLALFMLAHIYLRRFTYPVTILFLVVMTIYLFILLVTKGNDVDCGCFGDTLPMTPAQSILKNIALLAIVLFLSEEYQVKPYRFQGIVAVLGAAAMMAIPFIFVPYDQKPSSINLNPLYSNDQYKPEIELRKGKHLIAFMSLGCPHCRNAARIFKGIYDKDSTTPIYMVLYGYPSDTAEFFQDTKANKIPHFVYHNSAEFIKLAGKFVPSIFWVNNSVKERKVTYVQLNEALLRNWNK